MPDNSEKDPGKIVLKIGKLRRYERPKTGPEDQPPIRLAITNLTLTRSVGEPPPPEPESPESNAIPPQTPAKSLIARIIPLWADPESRRWLVRKVFLPSFLTLLVIALALIADSGAAAP